MASSDEKNVFGKPITDGTRKERALEALKNRNADGKEGKAIAYLREQKELAKKPVSALCMFYNATGETLVYNDQWSWDESKVYDQYPERVQNGQWGAFLHIGTTGRSSGYVVYRVKNNDSSFSSQLLGWGTPSGGCENVNSHAYCNIFKDGEVDPRDVVYEKMKLSGRQHVADENELHTTADIQEGTSPVYKATLTREEAENSVM